MWRNNFTYQNLFKHKFQGIKKYLFSGKFVCNCSLKQAAITNLPIINYSLYFLISHDPLNHNLTIVSWFLPRILAKMQLAIYSWVCSCELYLCVEKAKQTRIWLISSGRLWSTAIPLTSRNSSPTWTRPRKEIRKIWGQPSILDSKTSIYGM